MSKYMIGGAAQSRRNALKMMGLLLAAGAFPTVRAVAGSQREDVPVLNERQLGHLAFIDRLSRQIPGDWRFMGADEPGQGGFDSYRYQLAMMSYAVALAQYHYTPAWREVHAGIDARLIEKMLRFDVWGYWELTSRGYKGLDPTMTELREGWIDPVRDENIMYSGHLFQMVTTHEMLYGGGRFDTSGSITFDYDPFGRGMGAQSFEYDVHSLAEVLASQFRDNDWRGIECEPNAIFPECNQHPLLGFALYDARYGSDYFSRLSEKFKERFDDLEYLSSETGSFMAFYMLKQDHVVRRPDSWSDGWSGTFMHAWEPELVEAVYPRQRDRHLVRLPDEAATVHGLVGDRNYSLGHGFFAALAAEVGDTDTRDAMLTYADRFWGPTWVGDALYYPREDAYKFDGDGPQVWRRVQPLTANGLLPLASMAGPGRLGEMFGNPLTAKHFAEPVLAGVDYPSVQVTHARYSAQGDRLTLVLQRGKAAGRDAGATEFRVENLDPTRPYDIRLNGDAAGGSIGGHIDMSAAGNAEVRWDNAGHLAFRLPLDGQVRVEVTGRQA